MKHNCFNCKHVYWKTNVMGECQYPLPDYVDKKQIRTGVWEQLGNGCYGANFEKVGAFSDPRSGGIEIQDCAVFEAALARKGE